MRRAHITPIRAALLAGFALSLAGCAPPPKIVTAITNNNDQIKFLYVQGDSQGIVKCAVAPDGALGKCRDMAVVLEE